jgi:hypothetical protein
MAPPDEIPARRRDGRAGHRRDRRCRRHRPRRRRGCARPSLDKRSTNGPSTVDADGTSTYPAPPISQRPPSAVTADSGTMAGVPGAAPTESRIAIRGEAVTRPPAGSPTTSTTPTSVATSSSVVPTSTPGAPATTDAPDTTDGPETTDTPDTTDGPETTDTPDTTDAPATTDTPDTTTTSPDRARDCQPGDDRGRCRNAGDRP